MIPCSKYRKTPYDVSKLVGTYRWVRHTDTRPLEIRPYVPETHFWDDITIYLDDSESSGTSIDDAMSALSGRFNCGELHGIFTSIRSKFPATYNISCVKWSEECHDNMPEQGDDLWVSEELDDNGYPFLGLTLNAGYSGCVELLWDMLGKRQGDDYLLPDRPDREEKPQWVGLSAQEKKRLALDMDEEDVTAEGEEENVIVKRMSA